MRQSKASHHLGELWFPYFCPTNHSQYASWKQLNGEGIQISTLSQSLSKQGNDYKHNYKWHPKTVTFSSFTEHLLQFHMLPLELNCPWPPAPPAGTGRSHPVSQGWEPECWQCRNHTRISNNEELFHKEACAVQILPPEQGKTHRPKFPTEFPTEKGTCFYFLLSVLAIQIIFFLQAKPLLTYKI